MLLVGPLRKHLTFSPSFIDAGNLYNIRDTKRPCAFILIQKPSANELKVLCTRRVSKNCHML